MITTNSSSTCEKCTTGCRTCTDAVTCQSCELGYSLVGSNCIAIPDNCVGINSTGHCTACFGGYALNSVRTGCNPDVSCNSNSSCVICPDGYFLQSGQCQTCSSHANCQACDASTGATCIKCNDGFYLDRSNVCQSCPTNCLTCDTLTYCTKASDGYYITLQESGAYSGSIGQCQSPCGTCTDFASSCLSCV